LDLVIPIDLRGETAGAAASGCVEVLDEDEELELGIDIFIFSVCEEEIFGCLIQVCSTKDGKINGRSKPFCD
tara:strand:- start:42 stop:257 length:216 start_codon:yes stop_codon:yes gene_type:complete